MNPKRSLSLAAVAAVGCLLFLSACATTATQHTVLAKVDDFVIVQPTQNDSFASLAQTYLNDPAKGWLIAEFNQLDQPVVGQDLVIPLKPFGRGGLTPKGYQTVPVLLYHRFSETKTSKMIVKASDFDAQMAYLKDNGYNVITIDQLMDFIEYKAPIPPKSVVITLDDGWKSTVEVALPILKKYGFTATLFVYPDFIGGRKALSWKQIKAIDKEGIDIQCHSMSHRNLVKLKEGESFEEYFASLDKEVAASKKIIESKVNKTCRYFAYPYGATNSLVAEMVKKNDFRAAFTVKRKSAPFYIDSYTIHRRTIYGDWDLKKFKRNLTTGSKGS